ncbi:hypothetical protein M9H77_28695 [Catharanthus roseus]|uniref:Uncharacterized protein n=1 Tax=Catharanthus roseus TaxID=4058 RepID=A0ACC0AHI1_CATRO|nr:hypothetical protein M9H77_28695 [Catharanthus roseus]
MSKNSLLMQIKPNSLQSSFVKAAITFAFNTRGTLGLKQIHIELSKEHMNGEEDRNKPDRRYLFILCLEYLSFQMKQINRTVEKNEMRRARQNKPKIHTTRASNSCIIKDNDNDDTKLPSRHRTEHLPHRPPKQKRYRNFQENPRIPKAKLKH